MKYTYFILLTTEMYFSIVECALAPDINLEGRLLTNNDSNVLQIMCSTNIKAQLCTVEFLIDKRTHDDIRYVENNCYHTMSICSPKVCTCSDDCMSFTLNVTVRQDMLNHLYSCSSRIEEDGVTYLANVSVIHNGNGGLKLYKKIVVPYSSLSPTWKATTFSPEISTVSILSVPLIIAGAAFGFLSCVLLVIILLMICNRYCNSKTAKEKTQNNNAQCDQQKGINSTKGDGQVLAETTSYSAGIRLSVASSNQSDNTSVKFLINASSNTNSVIFIKDQIESTFI